MFGVGGVAVKFVGRGLQFSVWPDLDARENTWDKSCAVMRCTSVMLSRCERGFGVAQEYNCKFF